MVREKREISQYLKAYEEDGSSPDLIKLYLNDLRKSPLLSPEEERVLAEA